MKLFIDSADLDQITELAELGIIDGVTTNPSLIAKSVGRDVNLPSYYKTVCERVDGDVSAEVISTDYAGMMREAQQLAKIDSRIVVKVPMLPDGVKAIRDLRQRAIRTNCTLVFSLAQALLAAKAGASYISPFIGRLDDNGKPGDGVRLVEDICQAFDLYQFKSKVLAASIRSVEHVEQCLQAGADVATCPYAILKDLYKHSLTDAGLEKFLADYKAAQ